MDFHIVPPENEEFIYLNGHFKAAALFEFYPDNGYETGYLKYDEQLISLSPNINGLTIKIDAGNGYFIFDQDHPYIEYDRSMDSLIGKAAIS